MTREEVKNYINNNLKIEIVPFGNYKFEIRLLLEGEEISKDSYTTN